MARRGAIYTRISADPEGLALGVARQEKDCRQRAERDGIEITAVYCDNDRGASTHSRKPRPEYARMIEAIEAGDIDVVLAYSNSRLTRRRAEFEQLIMLHERTGVRFLTVVSGDDDLSTADGRMTASIKASVDAGEAERIAERVKRAVFDKAREGRPHGGRRPFGWQDDRLTLDPVEHAMIREIADRLLASESLYAVAKDLNTRDVRPVYGGPWRAYNIKLMLLSPRMAGFRTHKDEIVARGKWEPALDEGTWRELKQMLTDPQRRTTTSSSRVALLSGIARCGECDRPVRMRYNGIRSYWCADCGLWRRQPEIDAHVEGYAIAYLEAAHADADPASVVDAVLLAQAEQLRERIAETKAAFVASEDAVQDLLDVLRDMRAKLAAVEARLVPPRKRRVLAKLAGPGAAERWDALTFEQRRANIADLFDIRLLRKASSDRGPFDPASVIIKRR